MSKVDIINTKGEKIKDIKLKDNVFIKEPNDAVLHNAIVLAQASLRQGTHKTKTRSEVSGGGRKPWRQKGTGNARQGSIRATQWRGGGIVFGPTPRDYSKKQNKKERRLALKSALSYKVIDKELIIVDDIKFETSKTKEMMNFLKTLNIVNEKVLIVLTELDENICLSSRNMGNVKVIRTDEVNTLDVVTADKMVITASALNKLQEALSNE
ncbi:MAG: 50S ribosomal protein L4 [Bacilli bacterium]